MSEMTSNTPDVFSPISTDMFEEGQTMTTTDVFATSWSCRETDVEEDSSQTPDEMSDTCQPIETFESAQSACSPDDKASDLSKDGADGLASDFQQMIKCHNETSSQTSPRLERNFPPSELVCIPQSSLTLPGVQLKQSNVDLVFVKARNEQNAVDSLVISTPIAPEPLHDGQLLGRQLVEESDSVMKQNPEQKEDEISESLQFLRKMSNSNQSEQDIDVLDLPPLPPGICLIPLFEDSKNAQQTNSSLVNASEGSIKDQEKQEMHDQDLKTSENHLVKQKRRPWHSSQLVIQHCAPSALKFKVKSAIPDNLLNTLVQTCQSSQNFPELKSQVKKLKLKVVQIARSVRQVIDPNFDSDWLIFCLRYSFNPVQFLKS